LELLHNTITENQAGENEETCIFLYTTSLPVMATPVFTYDIASSDGNTSFQTDAFVFTI
jgi:hypothetical protein